LNLQNSENPNSLQLQFEVNMVLQEFTHKVYNLASGKTGRGSIHLLKRGTKQVLTSRTIRKITLTTTYKNVHNTIVYTINRLMQKYYDLNISSIHYKCTFHSFSYSTLNILIFQSLIYGMPHQLLLVRLDTAQVLSPILSQIQSLLSVQVAVVYHSVIHTKYSL